jgi:hypothetical protein
MFRDNIAADKHMQYAGEKQAYHQVRRHGDKRVGDFINQL